AETVISRYLEFPEIRKLRIEKLMREKSYEEAIDMIKDGIKIAEKNNRHGTVESWKDKLLDIYLLQKNTGKIISAAEDLFLNGHDSRKYYAVLKKHTTQNQWPDALQRLLSWMEDPKWNGTNDFKAEILIEHQMWDRLFSLCKKGHVERLEKYEKYLKP